MWEELEKDVSLFLELMRKYNIDTLEVQDGDFKVRLVMHQQSQQKSTEHDPLDVGHDSLAESRVANQLIEIKSPTVGTFWLKKPNNKILCTEGEDVKEDQVIAFIEMIGALHYEVKAPTNGKVVKILAEEGYSVEYGQVLMLIEPT